jgi:hypothetical protein
MGYLKHSISVGVKAMIKKWKCYCSAIVQSFFPAPIGITGKSIAISSKKKKQKRDII